MQILNLAKSIGGRRSRQLESKVLEYDRVDHRLDRIQGCDELAREGRFDSPRFRMERLQRLDPVTLSAATRTKPTRLLLGATPPELELL
jgi:hypothetical protein